MDRYRLIVTSRESRDAPEAGAPVVSNTRTDTVFDDTFETAFACLAMLQIQCAIGVVDVVWRRKVEGTATEIDSGAVIGRFLLDADVLQNQHEQEPK